MAKRVNVYTESQKMNESNVQAPHNDPNQIQ